MNTVFLLMAEFESPVLPLEEVAPKYFGISSLTTAKRMAAANEFPVAFFRVTSSNKCPWHCHIQDLADLIDSSRQQAKDEYKKFHG